MIPGELVTAAGEIELNAGRETQDAAGDEHRRPADPGRVALRVRVDRTPRSASIARRRRGFRLDVPAGTSVRFEPGAERDVDLVALGGTRTVRGLQR